MNVKIINMINIIIYISDEPFDFINMFFRTSIKLSYLLEKDCNMYSIIEFEDGVFAVPTIWLSTDKKSKWSPYKDRKIFKAISKREDPDNNWEDLNVMQILGTARKIIKFFKNRFLIAYNDKE